MFINKIENSLISYYEIILLDCSLSIITYLEKEVDVLPEKFKG